MPGNSPDATLGQSLLVPSKSSDPLREPEVVISVFGHSISLIATVIVLATSYNYSSTSQTLGTVWYCMLVTTLPSFIIVVVEVCGRSLPLKTHRVIVAICNAILDIACVAVAFVSGMAFQSQDTDVLSSYACVWTFVYAAIGVLGVFAKAYDAAADSSPKMRFSSEDEVRTIPSESDEAYDASDNA